METEMNLHGENESGQLPTVPASSPAGRPDAAAGAPQSPPEPPRRPPTTAPVINRAESEGAAIAAVPSHHLAATTHTVELSQLAEINERLAAQTGSSRITAGALGLSSATPAAAVDGGREGLPVPATAVLIRLCGDGPPEYPYIHGHFALPTAGATADDDPQAARAAGSVPAGPVVAMHSPTLSAISHALGLRHRWGT
jgi:hypothetical protein